MAEGGAIRDQELRVGTGMLRRMCSKEFWDLRVHGIEGKACQEC